MSGKHSGIAYVELYVTDDQAAVEYYTRGLWFDQIAFAQGPTTRSTLLHSNAAQVIITAPTRLEGPMAEYVTRHGDGVADVALYHQDLAAVVENAETAGLHILVPAGFTLDNGAQTARVDGAGSTHHTLISSATPLLGRLPAGFDWEESTGITVQPATQAKRRSASTQGIDHLAWCLPEEQLEAVTAQYREAFGMRVIDSE